MSVLAETERYGHLKYVDSSKEHAKEHCPRLLNEFLQLTRTLAVMVS